MKTNALGVCTAGLLVLIGGTAWAGAACCGAGKQGAAEAKGCGKCGAHKTGGSTQTSEAQESAVAAVPATAEVKAQTICPIMNAPINRKLYVDHDGKRIYLCCRGCVRRVTADPEKYIRQLEDQGVTLEKVPAE